MAFVNTTALAFSKEQIVIGLTHGAFGSHIGLAFHSAKEGVQLLHLRFHRDISSDPFPVENKCWIITVPEVHKTNSKILIGIVRALANRKPTINFGINLFKTNGSFDANGRYTAPRGSDGLTCATFISEIFRAAGLPLVRNDTWETRDSDVAWGDEVCNLLKTKGNASDEHIAAVRANINGLRLRPEEVAFAADQPSRFRPMAFAEASGGGATVMTTLHIACPLPASTGPSTEPFFFRKRLSRTIR